MACSFVDEWRVSPRLAGFHITACTSDCRASASKCSCASLKPRTDERGVCMCVCICVCVRAFVCVCVCMSACERVCPICGCTFTGVHTCLGTSYQIILPTWQTITGLHEITASAPTVPVSRLFLAEVGRSSRKAAYSSLRPTEANRRGPSVN